MQYLSYIPISLQRVFALVFTGILLSASFCVSAQRYPFYNLNVESGLIQSQATCLAQDPSGNLWIGTIGGLSRYDGKNITNYTVRNGLLNNMIHSIAVDAHGNIWTGGPDGLSEFNGKTFKHYAIPFIEKSNPGQVFEVRVADNDTVWCRTYSNIYYTIKGQIHHLNIADSLSFISAILPGNGHLWYAKEGVVYDHYSKKTDSFRIPVTTPVTRIFVSKFLKDKNGMIWLATNAGLYKIQNGTVSIHYLNNKPLNDLPALISITQDSSGAFWFGTNSGAIRLTEHSLQYYNKKNGLSDNILNATLTDKEGNVWFASDGQGLFRYSGMQFTGLDETMGLPSAQVMGIAANESGDIFLGTYDAGLFVFKEGKVENITFPSELIPRITTLQFANGKLWIGTRGRGLWTYDGSFTSYTTSDHDLPSNVITSFYTDPFHRLWIGFPNGAVMYEHDSFKKVPLNSIRVSDFITIGSDSLLMSTDNGLKLYNNSVISAFKTNTAADSSVPECLTLLHNELWIGSSDNGVIRYDLQTKKALVINKNNGLQSDFVYTLIPDNENNIWAGTGYGIHKISLSKEGQPVITFYGTGQGIGGMESNHKSVIKMHDGSIWFGTTNGALHYLPHSANTMPRPISIVMQSVKLFGENISDTTYYDSTDNWYNVPYNLRLPYRKNNITFSFHAVSLHSGSSLLYRYIIDGLDAPWSAWSANSSVTYSALPPGNYVFKVQCMAAGSKELRELQYPFEIITPFQRTRWFRLIILAACILLGIAMQYTVNKRKQRREQLLAKLRLEEQAKIRMRTAEDFHDEVGNKITRINVLTNVLKNKIGKVGPDINRLFTQIEENTGQLYSGTQDILWSLKPSNDSLYEILHRIKDFGNDLFEDTDTEFIFIGADEKWKDYRLPLDMSRNLIMIFKEALNNCLKYSKASTVKMETNIKAKDILQIVLTDNGVGFDIKNATLGHGINNMNIRTGRLNGRLYIDSGSGKGTMITLSFKIPSKRG